MDMELLESLGFEVVAGNIDRHGKNYGTLTKMGPQLNAAGEELVMKLMDAKADKPKRATRVSRKKEEDPVEDPVEDPADE